MWASRWGGYNCLATEQVYMTQQPIVIFLEQGRELCLLSSHGSRHSRR